MRYLVFSVLILVFGLFTLTSCDHDDNCISGQGNIETRTLNVEEFTGINLLGATNVTITQGVTQEVVVTGHPNIIDRLETDVVNDIWEMELRRGCYNHYELEVFITVPDMKNIIITGSGNVDVNPFTNQGNLELAIIGSGNIFLDAFSGTQDLSVSIVGSGNVLCTEDLVDLQNLTISIVGSGNFEGFAISVDVCTINIEGSGDCLVHVLDLLNVTIDGSGNVRYKGTPTINADIRGSGDIINAN